MTTPDRPWKPVVAGWPAPWPDLWERLADAFVAAGLKSRLAEAVAYLALAPHAPAEGPLPDFDRAWTPTPICPPTERWRCTNQLHPDPAGHGWWRSIHGVVGCAVCRPVTDPGLIVAAGPATNAPLVFTSRTTTPVDAASPELQPIGFACRVHQSRREKSRRR